MHKVLMHSWVNHSETFMLHYNFPPYSVGEVGKWVHLNVVKLVMVVWLNAVYKLYYRQWNNFLMSCVSCLKLLNPMVQVLWPASVAASLAMMDAGVPIKAPVAGIAMGLIKEADAYQC